MKSWSPPVGLCMLRVLVKALQLVLCFDFFTFLSFSFRFMSFFFDVSIYSVFLLILIVLQVLEKTTLNLQMPCLFP